METYGIYIFGANSGTYIPLGAPTDDYANALVQAQRHAEAQRRPTFFCETKTGAIMARFNAKGEREYD